MGTRADFYIGRNETAEWLGSIAWDGYPDGIAAPVVEASTVDGFRNAVIQFAAGRDDWTSPDMGWPWPWDNSGTTDYAYAFDGGIVWASCFGGPWFDASQPEPEDIDSHPARTEPFPDMSQRKATTLGPRSGVIITSA